MNLEIRVLRTHSFDEKEKEQYWTPKEAIEFYLSQEKKKGKNIGPAFFKNKDNLYLCVNRVRDEMLLVTDGHSEEQVKHFFDEYRKELKEKKHSTVKGTNKSNCEKHCERRQKMHDLAKRQKQRMKDLDYLREKIKTVTEAMNREKEKVSESWKKDTPKHYNHRIQPVEAIEEWGLNFNLGNALKYIARAGKKDEESIISDLKKAQHYIQIEIESIERKNLKK